MVRYVPSLESGSASASCSARISLLGSEISGGSTGSSVRMARFLAGAGGWCVALGDF